MYEVDPCNYERFIVFKILPSRSDAVCDVVETVWAIKLDEIREELQTARNTSCQHRSEIHRRKLAGRQFRIVVSCGFASLIRWRITHLSLDQVRMNFSDTIDAVGADNSQDSHTDLKKLSQSKFWTRPPSYINSVLLPVCIPSISRTLF